MSKDEGIQSQELHLLVALYDTWPVLDPAAVTFDEMEPHRRSDLASVDTFLRSGPTVVDAAPVTLIATGTARWVGFWSSGLVFAYSNLLPFAEPGQAVHAPLTVTITDTSRTGPSCR